MYVVFMHDMIQVKGFEIVYYLQVLDMLLFILKTEGFGELWKSPG